MPDVRDVRELSIDQLTPSSQQARKRDIEKGLDELVESIRVQGLLEPIIVTTVAGDRYEIIAGQRRWLAMKKLGMPTIRAIIVDDLDEVTAQAISVSENLVRRDLSGKDLVDVCTRLYRRCGSIKSVSEQLGLPYGKVRNYVRFDRLRQGLKDLVESGDVDIRTALRLEDHFRDKEVNAHRLRAIADTLAGMTNAQKADYLAVLGQDQSAEKRRTMDGGPVPEPVRQIVVTLRAGEVDQLRRWAKAHALTQDEGAARVIRAFLRSSMDRATILRGDPQSADQ